MPGPTATIDRDQRNALCELVLKHLSAIGDLWIAVGGQRIREDRATRHRVRRDLRLVHDLGWREAEGRKDVDLMPPHDLMELLRRLHGEAECVLVGSASMRLLQDEEEKARGALPASQERL